MKLLIIAIFMISYAARAEPELKGGLGKGVIDEHVKRHMPQLEFCYERQLNGSSTPKSARIETHFTIDAKGKVTKLAATPGAETGSKLEKCVLGIVQNIIFPEPAGGGTVDVDYPFSFEPPTKRKSK